MRKLIWIVGMLVAAALIIYNWVKIFDDRYNQIVFSSVLEAASLVDEVPEKSDDYIDIDSEFEKKK